MSKIILAIKPEYVNRILKEEKRFEFRKRIPKLPVDTLFVYCTHPVMKVVASVEVLGIISGSPTAVWEQTKHAAGISRTHYRNYFHRSAVAYAFSLGEVKQFDEPVDITFYGLESAPQSFVYLHDNLHLKKSSR